MRPYDVPQELAEAAARAGWDAHPDVVEGSVQAWDEPDSPEGDLSEQVRADELLTARHMLAAALPLHEVLVVKEVAGKPWMEKFAGASQALRTYAYRRTHQQKVDRERGR